MSSARPTHSDNTADAGRVGESAHPSHDGIVDLYIRHAAAWDAGRGPHCAERPWLDRFCALLPPLASILDVGCGAGQPIATGLVARGHAITGIDSSEPLIRLCRERMPSADFIVADMRRLSLPRCFDGIIAWDSFFHLCPADQRAMFPIFAAHAKAGTALLFTTGPRAGEAIGTLFGEPLYHASLDPQDYRTLLDAHGFDVVSRIVEDQTCGGHTIWLARQR